LGPYLSWLKLVILTSYGLIAAGFYALLQAGKMNGISWTCSEVLIILK